MDNYMTPDAWQSPAYETGVTGFPWDYSNGGSASPTMMVGAYNDVRYPTVRPPTFC